jgi:hypothetical protein
MVLIRLEVENPAPKRTGTRWRRAEPVARPARRKGGGVLQANRRSGKEKAIR